MRRLMLAVVVALAAAAAFAQTQAVVQSVSGRVEVMQPGGAWTPAAVGTRLPLGATISTSFQSQATLELGATVIAVKALTRMRIDQLVQQEGTVSTDLFLRTGRIRAEVKTTEGLRQDFKVRSPVATAAVRGTTFEYDGVNVEVEEGTVHLADQNNQGTSVGAGEQGTATGDEPPAGGEQKQEEQATTETSTGRGGADTGGAPKTGPGSIRINWQFYYAS